MRERQQTTWTSSSLLGCSNNNKKLVAEVPYVLYVLSLPQKSPTIQQQQLQKSSPGMSKPLSLLAKWELFVAFHPAILAGFTKT